MQETCQLRELNDLYNLPQENYLDKNTPRVRKSLREQPPRPPLEQLLHINTRNLDFGLCLPGSIHQKTLTITILQQPLQKLQLSLFIVCEDEALNDQSQLVFGISQQGQSEYYDDYRMNISNEGSYKFRVGVKTPLYYSYDVRCYLGVKLANYAPFLVTLTQIAQIPEIVCPRQLVMNQSSRVIKLSVIQGKSKKECRVPFKLNHAMTISMVSEIIGLQTQKYPLIDVKPKSMTLAGKGQFSMLISMGVNEQIREAVRVGRPITYRRILTLKIKDTKYIYHFPLEVTYYPEKRSAQQIVQ